MAYENGGGAFLIPYTIVLILVSRPIYFLELALGQFSSAGPVNIWDMVPALGGVGYGQVRRPNKKSSILMQNVNQNL